MEITVMTGLLAKRDMDVNSGHNIQLTVSNEQCLII